MREKLVSNLHALDRHDFRKDKSRTRPSRGGKATSTYGVAGTSLNGKAGKLVYDSVA
jgi:hypothetical protein